MLADDDDGKGARGRSAVLKRAVRIFTRVEELPALGTGLLRYGQHGVILVDSRRICWAVATGMDRRLTELLRHQRNPPIDRTLLDRIVHEGERTGRLVGEALVARGEVTEAGLRAALCLQTSDAIAIMAQADAACDEFALCTRHHADTRFVFQPAELLAALGGQRHAALAAAARAQLRDIIVTDSSGVAFVDDGATTGPVIIAVQQCSPWRVTELLGMCHWVAKSINTTAQFAPGERIAIANSRDCYSVIWWRVHGAVFCALCMRRAASARIVERLAARLTEPGDTPTDTATISSSPESHHTE